MDFEIREILKSDIPSVLNDESFWNNSFLSITRHRLFSHFQNPVCLNSDIVLLVAYRQEEIVGYLGVYMDSISLNERNEKIGWLSTWWVHPKTKGSGIGRALLTYMYESLDGKIGISQFTESARRVYDKSGYFQSLNKVKGYKFVYRSNLTKLLPSKSKIFSKALGFLKLSDFILNIPANMFNNINRYKNTKKLKGIQLEYISTVDKELKEFIDEHSLSQLFNKIPTFFSWLKANHWVQEAPVVKLTNRMDYEFSMNAIKFNIYLVKIIQDINIIGFLVLQRKDYQLKVLFAYYLPEEFILISRIILAHALNLKVADVICYDPEINAALHNARYHLYKRDKVKEAIISKAFSIDLDEKYNMQYGDGDCCFA